MKGSKAEALLIIYLLFCVNLAILATRLAPQSGAESYSQSEVPRGR
jgi:hypothetical protein